MNSSKEEQCLQHSLWLISLHSQKHKTYTERPRVTTVGMKDDEQLYTVFRARPEFIIVSLMA